LLDTALPIVAACQGYTNSHGKSAPRLACFLAPNLQNFEPTKRWKEFKPV